VSDPARCPTEPRRGALTVGEIVEVALAEVRRHGLGALTMRRLADRLGVTPMAVYHHLPSKHELLRLVVERVGVDVRLPHDGRPWTDQMRHYAMRWREELHRHPGVARHLLTQEAPPATAVRVLDDAVGLLSDAGFDEREAARAYAALVTFVLTRVDLEEVLADTGTHGTEVPPDVVAALGDDHDVDYGRVVGYLEELTDDDHFTYMLDALLAGIDAHRRGR
jgi:AcrR family transcriptional regulator